MALNELINQIVDVNIRNVTSNTFSRDLNTILILTKEQVIGSELYRVYQDSSSMLEDGWDMEGYAYNAVRLIFSQEYTPVNVVVAQVEGTGTNQDYLDTFNKLLMIEQGWLWIISDLRDVSTQVTLAEMVEANDKMYMAATHETDALEAGNSDDLASKIKAKSLSRTAVWYDKEFP